MPEKWEKTTDEDGSKEGKPRQGDTSTRERGRGETSSLLRWFHLVHFAARRRRTTSAGDHRRLSSSGNRLGFSLFGERASEEKTIVFFSTRSFESPNKNSDKASAVFERTAGTDQRGNACFHFFSSCLVFFSYGHRSSGLSMHLRREHLAMPSLKRLSIADRKEKSKSNKLLCDNFRSCEE